MIGAAICTASCTAQRGSSIRLRLASMLGAVALFMPGSGIAADSPRTNPRAGVEFYIQTYGQVAPAALPDVYTVFERVSAVADKSNLVTPRLIVVNDSAQASAFALSDGSIFISTRTLALIREGATLEEAQARLAFVLGHELAHLASNDFWDNQIGQALLDSSTAKELVPLMNTSAGQQKEELKADDQGFLYAALAGYRVDTLLRQTRSTGDFLNFWDAKAGRRHSGGYPRAEQRTSLLQVRLQTMSDALQYFEFGTRLMHFGRYREAIDFLRAFQQQFPSRELFNNLGYCYLRLGASQLDPGFAHYYWLPMVSDVDSPLAELTMRSGQAERKQWRVPAAARENLLQAVRYFELASEKDRSYAPAQLNLAVSHLLLGMDGSDTRLQALGSNHLLRAKLAADTAIKLQLADAEGLTSARILAAVVDAELQFAQQGSQRVNAAAWERIDDGTPTTAYNLAQLARGEPVLAARYWRQLSAQFYALPRRLQSRACKQTNTPPDLKARCDTLPNYAPVQRPPWALPIAPSRDLLETPISTAELQRHTWRKVALGSNAAFVGANSAVLAMDEIASLVVLKQPAGNAESLLQCCSQPAEKIPVANGTLWHYGRWIALVRNASVDEVWVSN